MDRNRVLSIVGVAIVGALIGGFVAKTLKDQRKTPPKPSVASPDLASQPTKPRTTPQELLATRCATCHVAPSPDHLPKKSWPFVLRWMGNYVGAVDVTFIRSGLVQPDYIPKVPVVEGDDLARLQAWLVEQAPTEAQMNAPRASPPFTDQFIPEIPTWAKDDGVHSKDAWMIVTLAHIDAARRQLLIGGGVRSAPNQGDRWAWTPTLRAYAAPSRDARLPSDPLIWTRDLSSEPVTAESLPSGYRLTLMGAFDTDKGTGEIIDLNPSKSTPPTALLRGGHRLTGGLTRDLDGDGRDDLVQVSFGRGYGPAGQGRLSVLWATDGFDARYAAGYPDDTVGPLPGAWDEQILLGESGPLNAVIKDMDGDGRDDILIARAQGHQALLLWRNLGDRRFEKKVLKEWFVSFGLNHVDAADFDGDGDLDLLVVSGNNLEIPDPPLRPYHGVRVLINEGDLQFKERFFHPMHGAIGATVRDFDGDGDLDIAAIALVFDWASPEPFVYLKNNGDLTFTPSGLPKASFGRWISIDSGDIDGDGAPDILLGSLRIPLVQGARQQAAQQALKKTPAVMILRNAR